MLDRYECKRCGHKWIPRIEHRPIECPGCKIRRWYVPAKKKGK